MKTCKFKAVLRKRPIFSGPCPFWLLLPTNPDSPSLWLRKTGLRAVLWIRIRMNPELLPGSGSGIEDPDPALLDSSIE